MTLKRATYFLFGLLMLGCSLQLVSTYDPYTMDQLVSIEKEIDLLYKRAEIALPEQREYQEFADQYLSVEVDIRALLRRQQRRHNNLETTQQVKILANLWEQDRQVHQAKDTLSNFIIKRRMDQYQRIFTALIDGENAKKID